MSVPVSERGRRLRRLWAPFALGLVMLLAACGGDDASSTPTATSTTVPPTATATATATAEADATIEAVDAEGAALVLGGPAERIVSYSPGVTEILFAIGAGDRVVAVDEFSYYPEETAALPKVSYASPDPEQVLAHEPDLVILASNQVQSLEQFRRLGLPVFYMEEPSTLDGVLEDIRTAGLLTGHEAEAEALAAGLEERLDAIAAVLEDVETGPRVFYELDSTLYSVSSETFIGAALSLLKAQNIADGAMSPYPQLTAEAVVDADPEVILLADAAFGVTVESVEGRPGWSSIAAVREGRIHPVDPDIMSRPGPRIVDGIESLAPLLYPERFE